MGDNPGFLTIPSIREAERQALSELPAGTLMQRAASAVADLADQLLQRQHPNSPVSALIGPGNNGADALLALMLLARRGYAVRAYGDTPADLSTLPEDACRVHAKWRDGGGVLSDLQQLPDQLPGLSGASTADGAVGLVIDGMFGIGLQRPLAGRWAHAAQLTHRLACPVLAIDVPSGLHAETGAIVGGERAAAVQASHTVTMIANKAGLHTGTGAVLAGQVTLADLDVPTRAPDGLLIDRDWVLTRLKHRSPGAHKGTFGTVGILGGAPSMPGAALLAATGARASGAGKVTVLSPGHQVFDPANAQIMNWVIERLADLERYLQRIDTIVAGCGLGTDESAGMLLVRAMLAPKAAVFDADALNLVAAGPAQPDLRATLIQRTRLHPTVLTPHPLEAARLLGITTTQVQQNRIDAALTLARHYGAVTVLKGAGSIIAAPDGRWAVCASGSAALATGGTGDCLAGMIGALLAQRYTPWEAAAVVVWIHGDAGQRWSVGHPRHIGMTATDLLHHVVASFNQL